MTPCSPLPIRAFWLEQIYLNFLPTSLTEKSTNAKLPHQFPFSGAEPVTDARSGCRMPGSGAAWPGGGVGRNGWWLGDFRGTSRGRRGDRSKPPQPWWKQKERRVGSWDSVQRLHLAVCSLKEILKALVAEAIESCACGNTWDLGKLCLLLFELQGWSDVFRDLPFDGICFRRRGKVLKIWWFEQ
jgi:hypothetical protein